MKRSLVLLLGWLGSALGGCVVYMPMQCAAPQITDKNQGELTASTYLNGRVEAAGTFSPAPHVLVRATYSSLGDQSQNPTQDSTYYRGHQYDVSVGTYWPLGTKWLVGGLGGFGQARSEAAYSRGGGIFSYPVRHEFDARYRKLFGEAYSTFQASKAFSLGAAYRITQVHFTSLTDQGTPVDLRSMNRGESMFFMRFRLGNGPTEDRPVQLQAAWGTSVTFGYDKNASNATYDPRARDLLQDRGYTTIGITLFPHCLFKRGKEAPL
jgi:hypothetical protein